jgi:cation diffusion facilitator CzcD-associated flavoprotein CzcO
MCSGYYNYAEGYTPDFPGQGEFKGQIVHPQHWPEALDYSGKQVVVIGSGATAVTLVPEMAKTAGHVTMLQRSPTYVVSRPAADAAADWLRAKLPPKLAYDLVRLKNVSLGMLFFNMARKNPEKTKERLLGMVRDQLGPEAVAEHFTPTYNPWDQRLCLVPDADLFQSLKSGAASVVTDHIETFTKDGIKLKSGETLKADIIVTATGLNMQLMSGMAVSVDGKAVPLNETFSYKGMMFSGVPNLASSFGYTNASWTLKCDLTCEYVCRLLNHMDRKGLRQATPTVTDPHMEAQPWLDFSSGYVQRGIGQFPKQGAGKEWKAYQNYAKDLMALRFGPVEDAAMVFSNPRKKAASRPVREAVAA